jgi:4,5-DOPA dioxygenase extradiol
MPVIFLAHGSPMLLDDAAWVGELARWADALPRPRAVLMLSAHWERKPITLGATRTVPLVYDFYNFPARYYQVQYPAPGAPELAERVRALAGARQAVADEPSRGLDHGAYVPLAAMYPRADVPVLQVSLPSLDPRALFELGETLAPLRREGVLIVGSGFLAHNLRAMDMRPNASTPAWAAEFDAWTADVLARKDVDALLDYAQRAPGVRMALPTHEHFVPVVAVVGAALAAGSSDATFPITGFLAGSLTRRSVQFG